MNHFIFEPTKFFPQCHAATIEELPDGRMMSAWFAGTREANPDTAIWGSIFNGERWSVPRKIVDARDEAHWNPVLFNSKDGLVHLFFKIGEKPENWRTYHMLSNDGKHWSNPKLLVRGKSAADGRGPVRSKPIILPDGAWLAPASKEVVLSRTLAQVFSYERPDVVWDAFTDRSEDKGSTWHRSANIPLDRDTLGKYGGVIQPTLWNKSNGSVGMFLRTTYGYVFESESEDGGRTWAQAKQTVLPNNNSGIDVLKLSSGLLVMAMNPVKGNWASRSPLSIVLSADDGKTWPGIAHIETNAGSFSYPALVETKYGFDLVYTWNRLSIAYAPIAIKETGNISSPWELRQYKGKI